MRASRAALLLVMQAGLLGVLAGCGLGTEVGNGDKPGKDGSANNGGGADKPSSQNNQSGASNGNTASDGYAPPSGASSTTTAQAEPGQNNMNPAGPSPAPTGAAAAELPFDQSLLFTSCASPFGQDLTTPWELSTADNDTVLNVTSDGKGTYTVSKGSTALNSYAVDATTPHAIKAPVGATPATDAYTCGPVTGVADGHDMTYTVTLTKDGTGTTVSWTIAPAAGSGTLPTLTEVVVTPPSGTAVTLNGSAPN